MRSRQTINIYYIPACALAGFVIWEFRDLISTEIRRLDHPFNLFTLAEGVFGPAFAIAAISLAAANKHLLAAVLFAAAAIVTCVTPLVVFIYGFAR